MLTHSFLIQGGKWVDLHGWKGSMWFVLVSWREVAADSGQRSQQVCHPCSPCIKLLHGWARHALFVCFGQFVAVSVSHL